MIVFSGRKRKNMDMDTAGTAASLLCAIHCALMPLVVTLLPLVGLGFLASEGVEWTLLALSAVLGCTSLCFGYRTHRRRTALAVLATGLALLAMGRLCEERGIDHQGLALVVLGGSTVAASHILNRRLCTACRTCNIDSI
jgi:hypothetical protein